MNLGVFLPLTAVLLCALSPSPLPGSGFSRTARKASQTPKQMC